MRWSFNFSSCIRGGCTQKPYTPRCKHLTYTPGVYRDRYTPGCTQIIVHLGVYSLSYTPGVYEFPVHPGCTNFPYTHFENCYNLIPQISYLVKLKTLACQESV